MLPKCPHCDRELPRQIEFATCPFCYQSLADRSVPQRSLDRSLFGGTLGAEDLQVGFAPAEDASASESETLISETPDSRGSERETLSPESVDDRTSGKGVENDRTAQESAQGDNASTLVFGEPRHSSPVEGGGEVSPDLGVVDASSSADSDRSGSDVPNDDAKNSPRPKSGRSGSGSTEVGSDAMVGRWADAADSSANPHHSIKQSSGESRGGDSIDLPIHSRSVALDPAPIDRDADYQIVEKIGAGSMGWIHKAKQHSIDRFVAIKTIKEKEAGARPEDKRKFLREAQITGSLDHPNIIPIHDLGLSGDGSIFYSMKLVEGTAWLQVIGEKSREENLEILLKVCDAVAFAHSRDVIHRDLKPENIMLGQFGEVLVMDWGLAVGLQSSSDRRFGMGGTPTYMAPEMARHERRKIGRASDIYLLGAILYEIINGAPPHPGKTVKECVEAAADNRIIPARDSEDGLVKVAFRAMATEPEDRYRTVGEFQDAIREYRRNAESVALSHRAAQTLSEALQTQDYQLYSKALIGFEDAVAMWEGNEAARQGTEDARREYGKSAFQKGDYDLALQLFREDVEDERSLITKARQAKREAEDRDRRIRRLKTSVLAVIVVGLCGAIGFSVELSRQKAEAERLAESETKLRQEAQELVKLEKEAKEEAARLAKSERDARVQEQEAKDEAVRLAKLETDARKEAQRLTKLETEAREEAERLAVSEKAAKEEAEQERLRAVTQSRLNLFRNYPAKLSLASIRVRRQLDVDRSGDLLREIRSLMQELEEDVVGAADGERTATRSEPSILQTPSLRNWDNWVYRRVKLLANAEIPQIDLRDHGVKGRIACGSIAADSNHFAVGTELGEVCLVRVKSDGFEVVHQRRFSAPVRSLAVSPDGGSIAFATDTISIWRVTTDEVRELERFSAKLLRYLAPSPYLAGVTEYGKFRLWNGDRGNTQAVSPPPVDRGGQGGQVRAIVSVPPTDSGSPSFAGLVSAGTQSMLRLFRPGDQTLVGQYEIPRDVPEIRAVSYIREDVFIAATDDGELIPFRTVNENGDRSLRRLAAFGSDVHSTAIADLAPSSNGEWLLSSARDEPAMQLWRSVGSDGTPRWDVDCPLLGHGTEPIVTVGFLAGGTRAVSIGNFGRCLLWDPGVQSMQSRISNDRNPELPVGSGIVPAVGLESAGLGITFNVDGVLDRWPLHGARGSPSADGSWDYAGHLPRAEVLDAVVSVDGTRLLTSARIDDRTYRRVNRQFCLWDLDSGQLQNRWEDRQSWADSNLSRFASLAFSRDAKHVFLGGKPCLAVDVADPTRVTELQLDTGGRDTQPAGHSLAQSPTADILAVASIDGYVHFFKSRPPFDHIGFFNEGTSETSDRVLRAAWDPEGETLFLALERELHAIRWQGDVGTAKRAKALLFDGGGPRPSTPKDVDLVVTSGEGDPKAQLAIRSATGASQVIAFRLDASELSLKSVPVSEAGEADRVISQGPRQEPRRLAATEVAENELVPAFVSSGDGGRRVVAIDESGDFRVVGESGNATLVRRGECRQAVVASTEHEGSWKAATLSVGGDVWCVRPIEPAANENDDRTSWHRLAHRLDTVKQIAISHDGSYLAVVGGPRRSDDDPPKNRVELWNWGSDSLTRVTDGSSPVGVEHLAWHPVRDEWVAWMPGGPSGGKLIRGGPGKPTKEMDIADPNRLPGPGSEVGQIVFFREPLIDDGGAEADRWYVALLAARSAKGAGPVPAEATSKLQLVEYLSDPARPSRIFGIREELGNVSKIAASPVENLLAIGTDAGTVSLWIINPSIESVIDPEVGYDEVSAYEVHDFEDHRGSPINSLRFSNDGDTLLSGDDKGYQYVWLSRPRRAHGQ